MNNFTSELIGTMLLILLGNGVVANVLLNKTNGFNSGWIVITFGWAMAVFVGVFTTSEYSGAHLNPAITIGFAIAKVFPWSEVPIYILGQMIGASLGAFMVWVFYKQHFDYTEDKEVKKAAFCTAPSIRHPFFNLFSETIGTFVLVFAVLFLAGPKFSVAELPAAEFGLGAIGALPVALLVFAIGLSLGGTTGYAINPARDLAPRIMHFLLPITGKRDSDWGYSWVPVVGPILGAIIAALLYLVLKI
jgi:glycerol uptake facilitator protein